MAFGFAMGAADFSPNQSRVNSQKPSRYGPFRSEPGAPPPKHAYSPFAALAKNEATVQPGPKDYVPGRVLFKMSPLAGAHAPAGGGATADEKRLKDTLARHQLKDHRRVFRPVSAARGAALARSGKPDLSRWQRAAVPEGKSVEEVLRELALDPAIEIAEPDLVRRMSMLPDASTDLRFGSQWHLQAVRAPEAWAYLQTNNLPPGGNPDIIVAVIDSGIDLTHPDLAANLWTGQGGEHGYNAITGSNDPTDDNGHGTHVAGIIAATGLNQQGGVGVAYNVKLMAIKAAQYSGILTVSDIAEAIYYAVDHGADIINMSFGGYGRSQVEEDALSVAFGQAVLVAAAGNDGKPNFGGACDPDNPAEKSKEANFYPAAYNWVLGVMAAAPSGDRAFFSNYDCNPGDLNEYEVKAPGVGILSTLPGSQYAAWAGTSMATPIVSGIAALLRTKFPDKALYSSRFLMGQLAAQGNAQVIDALNTLTNFPEPKLSYLAHWFFDPTTVGPNNDNDGIMDAGETIDLGLRIRNHWGQASHVTATLEAFQDGVSLPDPYVTMLISNVNYSSLGAFSESDNGLTNDAQGALAGVTHPFRFQLATNTPNNHVVPFRVTLTCSNGLDATDTRQFSFTNHFSALVQRGRQVPRFITNDFTLTPDYFWLANGTAGGTLVEAGATLRVAPGTQVEFTTGWDIEGGLIVEGTPAEPVELFSNPLVFSWVGIGHDGQSAGPLQLRYARIHNLRGELERFDVVDHCELTEDLPVWAYSPLRARVISNSIFRSMYLTLYNTPRVSDALTGCLFDHCALQVPTPLARGNVFLISPGASGGYGINAGLFGRGEGFQENAILNQLNLPLPLNWRGLGYQYPSNWMTFIALNGRDTPPLVLVSNFWGTTSPAPIKDAILDFDDDFGRARSVVDPILTNAPINCFPFVAAVRIRDSSGQLSGVIGVERATFEVEFNRDMNTNKQPQVSFGPAIPYTDSTIRTNGSGGWTNARVWIGEFTVSPGFGGGFQFIRVAGAVAADDPWLVTGNDAARFQFEIRATTSESLNLQASGGEGFVDLSWMQDDFELLAGFNLYRATQTNGPFTRLNATVIPPDQRAWRDRNVQPGQTYFYKFTVVKTDFAESDFSNLASATPLDTLPPVVTHTPLTSALPGLPLTLFADVTDNVGVQGVTLFFRAMGTNAYLSRTLTRTTGNRYAATIEGSRLVSPGIEYYIEATDGITVVRSGRPEAPHPVVVNDRPVITAVTPNQGSASGGSPVTIGGANFKAGASVSFGGSAATNVVVINSSQINCVTPPHFPAAVDVTVLNPDSGSGTALNGYTFQSDVVSLSLPDTSGAQQSIVSVPINAADLNGVAAASLTVTFDSTIVRARTARLGNLTPGWFVAVNTNTAGQIRISMASPGPTSSGSGILAYLDFEVLGFPNSSTALNVASVSLNDGAVQVQAANGSFTVNRVFNVAGTVRYWNGSVGVPGVTGTLLGNKTYSGTSGTNGVFAVAGAEAGDYTLSLSKSDDANGISAFDASLVLQHDVGLMTLTGPAAIAADVNKSGQITAFDAFYILQKAVDSISLPFPGAGKVWEFQPGRRTVQGLTNDLNGQDFTAILLGDVSGNWAPGAGIQSYAPVTVALKTLVTTHPAGTNIWLLLKSPSAVVYGIDLTLAYDSGTTRVRSIQPGPLGETFATALNTNQSGVIRVALASAVPLQGIGGMLLFDVGNSPAANLLITNISINEGLVEVQIDLTGATFDLDSDGDGHSDWQEIRAGTDPLHASQYLGVESLKINNDGSKTIRMFSVPGKVYQLQHKNNLSDTIWSNAGNEITATAGITSLADPVPSQTNRFYRVKLVE